METQLESRAGNIRIILVGTHYASEMLAIERTIQRNDRERIVRPALVEWMLWR